MVQPDGRAKAHAGAGCLVLPQSARRHTGQSTLRNIRAIAIGCQGRREAIRPFRTDQFHLPANWLQTSGAPPGGREARTTDGIVGGVRPALRPPRRVGPRVRIDRTRKVGSSSQLVGLKSWNRWVRACALACVTLYAAFLIGAPLAHHDFACHRTTPAHCPSCVAAQPGPDVPVSTPVVAAALTPLGIVAVCLRVPARAWSPSATVGRAPPALSS